MHNLNWHARCLRRELRVHLFGKLEGDICGGISFGDHAASHEQHDGDDYDGEGSNSMEVLACR